MSSNTKMLLRRSVGQTFRQVSRTLPNLWFINYALALPHFWRGNKRVPRSFSDPRATLNDIIFHRMIRNSWSVLHQSCVDKEYAKILAQAKAPCVKIAKVEAVLRLHKTTTPADVAAWLKPFLGRKLVVKPTHSFGAILYLDEPIDEAQLRRFVRFSKKSFFPLTREAQYNGLEKKLIIEQNVASTTGLTDYKFSCADGHILHGRMDVDRCMPSHRRALFTVPDFNIIPVCCGGVERLETIVKPPHFADMIEIASQLSRGFDFVRVDLYDTDEGVYFGEFTFTPAAGSCSYSDEEIAIEMARKLRAVGTAKLPLEPSLSTPEMLALRQSSAQQFAEHSVETLPAGSGGVEPLGPDIEETPLAQAL